MRITEHFNLQDFACRDGSPYPPEWINSRLIPLCQQLELIRFELGGHPMIIDSGFRTINYNMTLSGAAKDSQHTKGCAADIRVPGITPHRVHDKALELFNIGLIKIGGLGSYLYFTHVDIREVVNGRLARWSGDRYHN